MKLCGSVRAKGLRWTFSGECSNGLHVKVESAGLTGAEVLGHVRLGDGPITAQLSQDAVIMMPALVLLYNDALCARMSTAIAEKAAAEEREMVFKTFGQRMLYGRQL